MLRYILETKDSPKGKWRPVRFNSTFTDQERAVTLAVSLDEHGNVCRVRSTGHPDGMDRTEFSS